VKVDVSDNKFEKAMRLFKKKVEENGIVKDLMKKEFYVKPCTARKLKKSAAKKRWQKFVESNKLPDRKY
jgi:small subunit ribosomal protein S21